MEHESTPPNNRRRSQGFMFSEEKSIATITVKLLLVINYNS